jgi:transcriptional regulator with XRE-family HTH domain
MPDGRLSIPKSQELWPVAHPEHPETLGERIAQGRRQLALDLRRDVTPADLAKMLEVNPATVYRWESNEKAPRDDALAALARLFGVSQGYLRYGVEGAKAPEVIPPAMFKEAETSKTVAAKKSATKKRRA